jgi:hypothetical protein
MNYYKLRIAWSAMWLAMALLLAVLWPLSYQAQYGIRYQGAPACAVVSTQVGSVFASIYNSPMIVPDGWRIMSEPINGADFVQGFAIGRTNAVQHWGVYISLPQWFAIMLCLAVTVLPWLPHLRSKPQGNAERKLRPE